MSGHNDKNQQMVQYIVSLTQKLSKTFSQLNEMSVQFLKTLNGNERYSRLRNRKVKDKEKEKIKDKNQDLNSNLIDEDEDEDEDELNINGQNPKKKLKIKNRIEEAEQESLQKLPLQQKGPLVKITTKLQQKFVKPLTEEKTQQKKKTIKPVSHKPKAPTSSFLLFFKQQQQSIAKSYPNYGVVQLTKVAAKCWNDLSVQDKEPYQKLFEVERNKYRQEMEKYRMDFPQEVKQKELEKKQKKKKKAKQRREKEGTTTKNLVVKQKPIKIVVNKQNYFQQQQQGTPSGVKIQESVVAQKHQQIAEDQNEILKQANNEYNEQFEEQMEEDSEEQNSLGEDI